MHRNIEHSRLFVTSMLVDQSAVLISLRLCMQQPGSSFCLDCVKKGKLPAGTSASDTIQVSGSDRFKEWTSKETLLLLEAVSRFGENWKEVSGFS